LIWVLTLVLVTLRGTVENHIKNVLRLLVRNLLVGLWTGRTTWLF
jgi:hypothetical protein